MIIIEIIIFFSSIFYFFLQNSFSSYQIIETIEINIKNILSKIKHLCIVFIIINNTNL
jgi:hypothetical protein